MPFAYRQIFHDEINKVNSSYSHPIDVLDLNIIETKCNKWMDEYDRLLNIFNYKFSICLLAKSRIKSMCEYFERTEQIVEFLMAINEIFRKVVCIIWGSPCFLGLA